MIPVRNPRTGAVDFELAPASRDDVASAAAGLRARQPAWEARGPEGRAEALRRLADAVEARAEPIAAALAVDTGRRRIAAVEVAGLPRTLRRWAERAPALFATLAAERDERVSATPGVRIATRFSAFPLIGAIAPWNFPLLLSHIDAVPALAAGAAALVKPSEVTPRFVEPLREAFAAVPEVPFEYILGGLDTGAALVEAVDYVCFTGSTATGRKVAVAAAERLIPANLELGGKDPLIVLASADPAAAAAIAVRASVVATGQACQSIERIYVAREIAEPFLAALLREAESVRLAWPDGDAGVLGPFIFGAQGDKVAEQIDDALAKGAHLLSGGVVEQLGGGRYLRPTVLTGVTPEMAVMDEETFGPVLPVTVFGTVEEAVALANESAFGLSAAVIAGTHEEAAAVGERLEAGAVSLQDAGLTTMVWDAANASRKGSGLGPSRHGDEGMLRFLRRQALIRQDGAPLPLAAYAEGAA